jgi:hypothetical protein
MAFEYVKSFVLSATSKVTDWIPDVVKTQAGAAATWAGIGWLSIRGGFAKLTEPIVALATKAFNGIVYAIGWTIDRVIGSALHLVEHPISWVTKADANGNKPAVIKYRDTVNHYLAMAQLGLSNAFPALEYVKGHLQMAIRSEVVTSVSSATASLALSIRMASFFGFSFGVPSFLQGIPVLSNALGAIVYGGFPALVSIVGISLLTTVGIMAYNMITKKPVSVVTVESSVVEPVIAPAPASEAAPADLPENIEGTTMVRADGLVEVQVPEGTFTEEELANPDALPDDHPLKIVANEHADAAVKELERQLPGKPQHRNQGGKQRPRK